MAVVDTYILILIKLHFHGKSTFSWVLYELARALVILEEAWAVGSFYLTQGALVHLDHRHEEGVGVNAVKQDSGNS